MSVVSYRNKQMLVMGPDRWPYEDQARAFFTVSTDTHQNIVRNWPWPAPARDHMSVGPNWEWSRNYQVPLTNPHG